MKQIVEYISQSETISSIDEYLLSKNNKQTKKANSEPFKLNVWDEYKFGNEHISSETLAEFILTALEKSKVDPKEIQEEISYYKDPDDLWDAYERDELYSYKKFEDTLADIIMDDDLYCGKEGDILEGVYANAYEIMDEVKKYLEKQ